MERVGMTLGVLGIGVVMAMSLSACGKKEEAKKPAAEPKEAKKADEAKKAVEPAAGDDKAAAPGAAAAKIDPTKMDGKERVAQSKALVDKMAVEMKKMVAEVEAAEGDRTKIRAISDKFKAFAEKHRGSGEALSQAMTSEEKAELSEYAKGKLAPLMSKMMAELMKAMAPAGDAPGAPADKAAADKAAADKAAGDKAAGDKAAGDKAAGDKAGAKAAAQPNAEPAK